MILLSVFVVVVVLGIIYCLLYYPWQIMAPGKLCEITTPNPEKYQNDCVHPCVRKLQDGRYVMVQSPWPAAQDGVENPILYFSNDPTVWDDGVVIKDTPATGYNSDPNVFEDDGRIYVFWREVDTPHGKEMGQRHVVVGGKLNDKGEINSIQVFFGEDGYETDKTVCPILIKRNGKYYFYTTWYRYKPLRKNIGIAIWEGTSLDIPDFHLVDTVEFKNPLVCDKYVQKKVFGHLFFVPAPKRYNMWHFDLFEYKGLLYMVSCAEMEDNIMLSVSRDWKHFKTIKCPLLNTHYSENHVGYRQFFYKPTAQIINGQMYLWYTSNHGHPYKNEMFLTIKSCKNLL